ncbi:MAG: hypothetical protein FJ317_01140 [SAR202 cluster bacterium]|nr:hypothetical protein [SAR202 cluster bacterium]
MLLEALLAVGLLTTALTMSLQGLATGSRAVNKVNTLTTAQNVARSQAAYTMSQAFCVAPCSYSTSSSGVPEGYIVTSEAETVEGGDENLALVMVSVYKDGELIAQVKRLRTKR